MRLSPRTGVGLALGSMTCVQLGTASSVALFGLLPPAGVAALRLVWAGVLLLVIARPRPSSFSASSLGACVVLGVVTAGMTLCFMGAVARIPLGTASAIEFLGPLGVAAGRSRGATAGWPVLAAVGVVLLTEPWSGGADLVGVAYALGAAGCWALYVVLTQRVGDRVTGLQGLAVSMPVAAVVGVSTALVVSPGLTGRLSGHVVLLGLGLALLLPVIPFALEMLALRRLTTTAFGTLMALEPAIALTIGTVALGQAPTGLALVGIVMVVSAGIGAARTGGRAPAGATAPDAPAGSPGVPEPGPLTVPGPTVGGPARCRPDR